MLHSNANSTEFRSATRVRSVLIVEDDALIAMTMESTARDLGIDVVHVATDTISALDVARDSELDCAILDVIGRPGSAYAIADVLVARNIPFVFCTGLSPCEIVERHRNQPVLAKPYSEADLKQTLIRVASL